MMAGKIIFVCTLFSTLFCIHVSAQQDSLAVVKAKWTTKKIARGIRLKHCRFDSTLFSSNQNIHFLEVKMKGRNRVDVGAHPRALLPTSKFAADHEALAALNGTFFDMTNGGSMDYIRVDGAVINPTRFGKNKSRSLHQKAAVAIQNGKLRILEWDGSEKWEEGLNAEDVMVSGPLLIKNGQRITLDTTSMYTVRHPRSALLVKGKKLLLITVEGRSPRAAGMSLYELASLLKWLGADEGINLDGGGSTTLWVKGNIVNNPSDKTGERPVANVILINKKK